MRRKSVGVALTALVATLADLAWNLVGGSFVVTRTRWLILAGAVAITVVTMIVAVREGQASHATSHSDRHVFGTVPDLADCFQTREVAGQVISDLGRRGSAATVVLSGLAGVGKSQIAAQVVRSLRSRGHADLVVWVSASDGPASTDAIVSEFARAGVVLAGGDPHDPVDAARAFLAWLETTSGTWLVVVDDLVEPAAIQHMWPPATPTGRTVITTRRRDEILRSGGRRIVDVGLYRRQEAVGYLRDKMARRPELLDGADQLVEILDALPLALGQAAVFALDRGITCAEYVRRWPLRPMADLVPEATAMPDAYRATMATVVDLSVSAANRLTPPGLAAPLLALLSVLDPNGVPLSVLSTPAALAWLTAERRDPPTDGDLVSAADARDGLHCLYRFNLAIEIPHRADPIVRVHVLVQRAVREHDPEWLSRVVHVAAAALEQAWPTIEPAKLRQVLRANAAALGRAAGDALWRSGVPAVLVRAGTSLGDSGQVAAAHAYFGQLAATAARVLGHEHSDTMDCRRRAIHWQWHAGDPAGAGTAYEQLLHDRERIHGPSAPETLAARGNLIYWWAESGDVAKAVAAFEDLLATQRRLLPIRHHDVWTTRANLAKWRGVAGDAAGAAAAFEELLSEMLSSGADDGVTGVVAEREVLERRGDLVRWRAEAGDLDGACAATRDLLTDRLRVLGADHPLTLVARDELAEFQGRVGDPLTATDEYRTLVADRTRVLGPDHPLTLYTRRALADWSGRAGDPSGAARALSEVLADMQRVLGPEHGLTVRASALRDEWLAAAGGRS